MGARVDHAPRADTFCADSRRTSAEHELRAAMERIAKRIDTCELFFMAASMRVDLTTE